jgi:glucose dehydrogenase
MSQRCLLIPALLFVLTNATWAQKGSNGADWPYISGDAGGTKYSPLDQINAANVSKLKIAWRWKSLNYGPRPDYNLEVTPLAIGGKLFFTAGTQRATIAVDGSTGETLWTYSLNEGDLLIQLINPCIIR